MPLPSLSSCRTFRHPQKKPCTHSQSPLFPQPLATTSSTFVCRFSYSGHYTGWGKSRFTVVSTRNRVYSCAIYYYIIFHTNICKPILSHPVCKWNHTMCSPVTGFFYWAHCFQGSFVLWHVLVCPSLLSLRILGVFTPPVIYSCSSRWTYLGCFRSPGCWGWCCCKYVSSISLSEYLCSLLRDVWVCPGVELLDHLVIPCLTFWGTPRRLSIAATPFYGLTSHAWGFQFPHSLTSTCHFPLKENYSHPS